MSTFSFEIEGVPMQVIPTAHAETRMRQRGVNKYASYGTIVALGEQLLDMKNGDEFCIMDKELGISVCCAMQYEGLDIVIYITTVLDNSKFFVKDGVQVFELTL
jgi:hypothetical protein